jgi:glycosyltransferase involved in cell wall biosynthesis
MSITSPLLSIIIPVYNSASFIEETLSKVYSQCYPNLECIIIDDGSTDNTAEIIQTEFPEVVYYYQENKGPAAARNVGLRLSKGDFIIFLDSDDYWEPNSLHILVDYLIQHPNTKIVEGKIREFVSTEDEVHFSSETYYMSNFGGCLFRKEVFEIVGLFDERLLCAQDIDWFIRAWENNIEKNRVDCIILNYRKHPKSLTATKRSEQQYYRLLLYKFKLERERQLINKPKGVLIDYIGKR